MGRDCRRTVWMEGRRRLGMLTIRVIAGRNLPAADRNGFSDPFVEVPRPPTHSLRRVLVLDQDMAGS